MIFIDDLVRYAAGRNVILLKTGRRYRNLTRSGCDQTIGGTNIRFETAADFYVRPKNIDDRLAVLILSEAPHDGRASARRRSVRRLVCPRSQAGGNQEKR